MARKLFMRYKSKYKNSLWIRIMDVGLAYGISLSSSPRLLLSSEAGKPEEPCFVRRLNPLKNLITENIILFLASIDADALNNRLNAR